MNQWTLDEMSVGLVLEHQGMLYQVIALINEPVAVLEPFDERDGEEQEHHVIASTAFSEFRRVELISADGTTTRWHAGMA